MAVVILDKVIQRDGVFPMAMGERVASVDLDAGDLRGLTTPLEIIPAPGAGFAVIPTHCFVRFVAGASAFNAPGAGDDLEFRYTNATGHEIFDVESTGLINGAGTQLRWAGVGATDFAPVDDGAVVLRIATAFAPAGADGTMRIKLFYFVVPTD